MKRVIANNIISEFHGAKKFIIDVLKKEKIKKISIWGAGLSGEVIYYLLNESSVLVENFYDSYKKGYFLGKKILNPYKNLKRTPIIIASSLPVEKLKEITDFLNKKNVKFFFANNMKYKTKSLYEFKNKHLNQRCFVIGNGPSLNLLDMNKLEKEVTIGANRIYLGFDRWKLNLKYWTIEDILVAEDTAEEWNNLKGPVKFIPNDLSHIVTDFENVVFFNFVRNNFDKTIPFFSDEWCNLFWGGTVTFLMLQIAAVMGCSPIYLIGVDFNYVKPKHITYGRNEKEWISHGDDPNHFHPDYFGNGRKWHDPMVDRMKKAFISAKKFFDKKDIKVFNATPGTKLDVFPLVDFKDLF